VPPDHINSALSVGVAEVIEVMMAKKRTDRYSSVKELLEDLRAVRAGEPPLQAHHRFDSSVLADLEKGKSHADEQLEQVLQNAPSHLGLKMAVIILAGALAVTILIIIVMLLQKQPVGVGM
jgi:eukaryotic-like serine/threonine-protein kinase